MSFAAPLVLGIVPVALVVVWWMFRPTRAAVSASFANIRRLWADRRGLSDSAGARRRRTHGMLLGLGALLALCALSEPQWGKIEETTYDQSREVLLALDLSRSMLADDVSPTRLDRAKMLIGSLLDQLRGERVGLVVFAGTSFLQSPMSADYEVLRDFLRDLDPTYLPQGGTEYGAMLTTALKAFGQEGEGDRYLVVLSDGEAQDAEWRALLPSLQQKGIHVIGLGVGTAAGALVPDGSGGAMKDERGAAVLSRLEPATLQELAAATGGTYRDAALWVDIAEVVQATVEQGRLGRYVEKKESRLRDRYQWFLAPALLLFLASYWLEFPVLPVPRLLRRRDKVTAPVRVAAMTAALLLAVASVRPSAAAMAPPEPASGGPIARPARPGPLEATDAHPAPSALESVVEELADKQALAAADYERLATTTIDLASKPESLPKPSRLGVIDDALRGVGEGEQIDAKAADWPKLRQELERLKQEEQKKQEQQSQQSKQDEQQQKGGQGSESQENQKDGGQQGQPQADAKEQPQDSGDQQGDPQKDVEGGAPSPPNAASEPPQSPQNAKAGEKDSDANDQQNAAGENHADANDAQKDVEGGAPSPPDAASEAPAPSPQNAKADEPKPLQDPKAGIGQLDTAKDEKTEKHDEKNQAQAAGQDAEPPKPATRLVGGGPVQGQPANGENLALVEALDRMDRIKDGDSPSTLFDRMNRAEGVRPQKQNGKNW